MKRCLRLLGSSGLWAPILVLIFHEFVSVKNWRTEIDWINHFSGGLAFTFFAFKSLPFFTPLIGRLTPFGRLAVAFLAGCTAALSWEILEFASDLMLGTNIQKSIENTMMDIVNGFLGTTSTVCAFAFLMKLRRANQTIDGSSIWFTIPAKQFPNDASAASRSNAIKL